MSDDFAVADHILAFLQLQLAATLLGRLHALDGLAALLRVRRRGLEVGVFTIRRLAFTLVLVVRLGLGRLTLVVARLFS